MTYSRVTNNAEYGGDARDAEPGDAGVAVVGVPAGDGSTATTFAGMSASQRYEFDGPGFRHLRDARSSSPGGLGAARLAVERAAAGGGARSSLGFTAEPPLQGLATHAALLPVLVELGAGSPRLVGGEAWVLHHSDDPAAAQQELGGAAAYRAEAPGRCRCDSVEVFCFLDTCEFGDS